MKTLDYFNLAIIIKTSKYVCFIISENERVKNSTYS